MDANGKKLTIPTTCFLKEFHGLVAWHGETVILATRHEMVQCWHWWFTNHWWCGMPFFQQSTSPSCGVAFFTFPREERPPSGGEIPVLIPKIRWIWCAMTTWCGEVWSILTHAHRMPFTECHSQDVYGPARYGHVYRENPFFPDEVGFSSQHVQTKPCRILLVIT